MNVEALKADTTLSAEEKHAVEKSLSNFFRLGIGEDNPRIISSQLQRHALKRGRSRFQYALSCECGSGVGNKVTSRCGGYQSPRIVAAGHDIEDTRRKQFMNIVCDAKYSKRSKWRRLKND